MKLCLATVPTMHPEVDFLLVVREGEDVGVRDHLVPQEASTSPLHIIQVRLLTSKAVHDMLALQRIQTL